MLLFYVRQSQFSRGMELLELPNTNHNNPADHYNHYHNHHDRDFSAIYDNQNRPIRQL
jgi:hypothetical protein